MTGCPDTLYAASVTKGAAHSAVRRARRKGTLTPQPCSKCGRPNALAHHADGYEGENALKVTWLCPACHGEEHLQRAIIPPAPASRNGQKIRGSDTDWSRRRLAANLSIRELAALSGIPRTVLGYIDEGRMVPKPSEVASLDAVLPPLESIA